MCRQFADFDAGCRDIRYERVIGHVMFAVRWHLRKANEDTTLASRRGYLSRRPAVTVRYLQHIYTTHHTIPLAAAGAESKMPMALFAHLIFRREYQMRSTAQLRQALSSLRSPQNMLLILE